MVKSVYFSLVERESFFQNIYLNIYLHFLLLPCEDTLFASLSVCGLCYF